MPYLSAAATTTRLSMRYGISATITAGDADAASWELDASGPFIGERLDSEQELAFPRNLNPDWTVNAEDDPPDVVLDRVALLACRLISDDVQGITSESIGMASWTYSGEVKSRLQRLLDANYEGFARYLDRGANTTTVGSSFDTRIYDEDYPYRWGLPLP